MPAQYATYSINIYSPSESYPQSSTIQLSTTVSVRVTEQVTNALAGVIGTNTSTAGAFSVARRGSVRHFPFSVYSDGCITTGAKTEIAAGEVYSGTCGINVSGNGGFCAESSSQGSGAIVLGPPR